MGPVPDRGSTFGFRKCELRGWTSDGIRRLALRGYEVFFAIDIFGRRIPPMLSEWLGDRPRRADEGLFAPAKAALFCTLLPVALILGLLGGLRMAGSYVAAVMFTAVALAIRGRIVAARFFPLRACLFAPRWLLESSISVYWSHGRTRSPVVVPTQRTTSEQTTASTR